MRSIPFPTALACASLLYVLPNSVIAHVIAGVRVFPVTLTFDDPGVNDEASLRALLHKRSGANGGTGPCIKSI